VDSSRSDDGESFEASDGAKSFHLTSQFENNESFDVTIARDRGQADRSSRERLAWALNGKGDELARLDDSEGALACYEEAAGLWGDGAAGELDVPVSRALAHEAKVLVATGREQEAIVVVDDLCVRFGQASERPVLSNVVIGLRYKEIALGALGRFDEQIVVAEGASERMLEALPPDAPEEMRGLAARHADLARWAVDVERALKEESDGE
jgi:hypothetical protein